MTKKADNDYIQNLIHKLKSETVAQTTSLQTELTVARKNKEDKVEERLGKAEMHSERCLDEVFFLRDQLKTLQEERKRDVEETADFIKQIINTGKSEQ